ncbi:hypothetical protein FRC01_007484, partial [Tulasnella sp. 417]
MANAELSPKAEQALNDESEVLVPESSDINGRSIKMEEQLFPIVTRIFLDMKKNYPDGFLYEHQHAEDDPNPCKFVTAYGVCFPDAFWEAFWQIQEYRRCAEEEFRTKPGSSRSEEAAERHRQLLELFEKSYYNRMHSYVLRDIEILGGNQFA